MQVSSEGTLFKDWTSEQLDLLRPLFESVEYAAGAVIFKQGDEATHLYLIKHGRVTIQYKPYDGPMITLSHLDAGQIFGWSAVAGGETYTSDAIGITEVQAIRVRAADLLRLCLDQPAVGGSVLEKLAEAVSPRWTYAREQIHAMLETQMHSDGPTDPGPVSTPEP